MNLEPVYRNLLSVLDERGTEQAEDTAFNFIDYSNDRGSLQITFGELRRRALSIAALLVERTRVGDRILLLYSPGVEYIVSFFGCLYSGRIAVPLYPPQGKRGFLRLQKIVKDVEARIALVDSNTECRISKLREVPEFLNEIQILNNQEIAFEGKIDPGIGLEIGADDVAFLQYTSGSTGDPKGVVVSHGNLLNNQKLIKEAFSHDRSTIVCSWLPPYHDMGLVGTILQPFYLGVPSVLMSPRSFLQKPIRWLQTVSKYRATTSGAPNFAYDLCVDKVEEEDCSELDLSCWTLAFNGSEPVRAETIRRFTNRFGKYGFRERSFYPCYGLAEATLIVAGGDRLAKPTVRAFSKDALKRRKVEEVSLSDPDQRVLVGCGQPVVEAVRIVDPEKLSQCIESEIGEVWVKGPGVSRGYWRQPEISDLTMRANFDCATDEAWLRTGDLGFLYNGEVYLTSRLKDLIIIRGSNHFPSDIEKTSWQAHDTLRKDAAVAFSVEVDGEERLVIVQEIERSKRSLADEAASRIRKKVAEDHDISVYEIIVTLPGRIPLTSSGKVRRTLCREFYLEDKLGALNIDSAVDIAVTEGSEKVMSISEERVADIWCEVLGVCNIPADSNFFLLGGDSLSATQVSFELQDRFGFEVSTEIVYENQTVRSLAKVLDRHLVSGGTPNSQPESPVFGIVKAGTKVFGGEIENQLTSAEGFRHSLALSKLGLSHQQRRVWFLSKLSPGSNAYNIPLDIRLRGELSPKKLKESLLAVASKHEILRSRVEERDGVAFLEISEDFVVPYEFHDLSTLSKRKKEDELKELKRKNAASLFDLFRGPMWRVLLVKVDEADYSFLLTAHHLISDGWSMINWFNELASFYSFAEGRVGIDATASWQYRQYVDWQMARMQSSSYIGRVEWWKKHLRGSPILKLPTDCITDAERSAATGTCKEVIPRILYTRLETLANEQETTPFIVLLTVFKLLLSRLSGQKEICVGYPSANRELLSVRGSLGFFANTLIAKTDFTDDLSFIEVLHKVKDAVVGGLVRQDVAIDDVVDGLLRESAGARRELFQAFFNMLTLPLDRVKIPGVEVSLGEEIVWGNKFDISLYARDSDDSLRLVLLYNTRRFSSRRADEMLGQYCLLLDQVVSNPQSIVSGFSLITEASRQFISVSDDSLESDYSLQPPFSLFENSTNQNPDNIAIVDAETAWSYRDLNDYTNRIAHHLIEYRIGHNDVVAVWGERSAFFPCAIISIHKVGAAFAVMDPSYPSLRLLKNLKLAKPKLILCSSESRSIPQEIIEYASDSSIGISYEYDRLVCGISSGLNNSSSGNPNAFVRNTDLAYLLFTSGTTGEPRCIEGTHAPVSSFLAWYVEEIGCNYGSKGVPRRFGMLSGLAHDPIIRDVFAPLCFGHTLHIPGSDLLDRPADLIHWLKESKIDVLHLTPSIWEYVFAASNSNLCLDTLRFAVFSGSTLLPRHVRDLRTSAPNATVINGYGTTETPQLATFYEVPDLEDFTLETSLPIGKGTACSELLLINRAGDLAGVGELAEICIRTPYLARGYRNSDLEEVSLSSEIETDSGFYTEVYRSGDFGRYDVNGNVVYVARQDQQISINGFRVELTEIEFAMSGLDSITGSVVLFEEVRGEFCLIAYYTSSREIDEVDLRTKLVRLLPEYMVPVHFVKLDKIPLTPNGKVDLGSLGEIYNSSELRLEHVSPINDTQKTLASIWEETLGINGVGLNDNFFALGGHSIKAVEVVSKVFSKLGAEIPVSAIFKFRTLEALSSRIGAELSLQQEQEVAMDSPKELQESLRVSRRNRIDCAESTRCSPASSHQRRLYLLQKMNPSSTAYNMTGAYYLDFPTDEHEIQEAVRTLVERHEPLRTFFKEEEGNILQYVEDEPQFYFETRSVEIKDDIGCVLDGLVLPFNLERLPLLRTTLFRVAEECNLIAYNLHHIAGDGESLKILHNELVCLLTGKKLKPLTYQYRDYAVWENDKSLNRAFEGMTRKWKDRLTGAPLKIDLPFDKTYSGNDTEVRYCRKLVRKTSREGIDGVTSYMRLLAALGLTLESWTQQADMVIGTVTHGRMYSEIRDMVGCFMNFIPIRITVDKTSTVAALVMEARNITLQVLDEQACPFEEIVSAINPPREVGSNPLFNVSLLLQNYLDGENHSSLDERKEVGGEGAGRDVTDLDLRFVAVERSEGIELTCDFSGSSFEDSTIVALLDSFDRALAFIDGDPSRKVSEFRALDYLQNQRKKSRDGTESIVLCGNFSLDPALVGLSFWSNVLGIEFKGVLAPFNQVFQQLLDPNSLFRSNPSGLNVIALNLELWGYLEGTDCESIDCEAFDSNLSGKVSELLIHLEVAIAAGGPRCVLVNCPCSPSLGESQSLSGVVLREWNRLVEFANKHNSLVLLDGAEIIDRYLVEEYDNCLGLEEASIPFSDEYYSAMATELVRMHYASIRKERKVIVVDCDNTLWEGVCGEDGPWGITISDAKRSLQKLLKERKDAGMLLCLCSKNHEEDVDKVFTHHSEMVLRKKDFVSNRINWESKSKNLRSLASELNVGLDSFVFIDDNPVECAEIEANCAEVLTICLSPTDCTEEDYLKRVWDLDILQITEEDRSRSDYYADQVLRDRSLRDASELSSFIENLNLEIDVLPLESSDFERGSQLSYRTNQFNFSGRRYRTNEIADIDKDPQKLLLVVEASDRFGNYGKVGLMVCSLGSDLLVESFMLSCRALGKGIEHRIVKQLGKIAIEHGCGGIVFEIVESGRNEPAWRFVETLEGILNEEGSGRFAFRLRSYTALKVEYRPVGESSAEDETDKQMGARESVGRGGGISTQLSRRIADELATASQIGAEIARMGNARPRTVDRTGLKIEYIAPRSKIERELVEVWRETLGHEEIGITHDFFILGGDSLQGVRMISKLQNKIGVKLPLAELFKNPTIEGLAESIVLAQSISGALSQQMDECSNGVILLEEEF